MADKTTASSSTANSTHSTNPATHPNNGKGATMPKATKGVPITPNKPTTQPSTGENNMFVDKLNIETRTRSRIVKAFKTAGTEITQSNLQAIVSGEIVYKGIGVVTIKAIETALAELIVEEEYKPRPISRSVKTTVQNKFTYGKKTGEGTVGNQARTIFDLVGNATSCLVMADDWSPKNKKLVAAYGFIPVSKTNKGTSVYLHAGETVTDLISKMLPEGNRETRRSYMRSLKKANPGLLNRAVNYGREIELPGFSQNSWKLSGYMLQEFLGSFMPNATRQREYARFFMTTHSAGVIQLPEYLIAPVVFLSSKEKLEELNQSLILSDGTKTQVFTHIATHSSGALICERWNDGQHWLSRSAAEKVGAHTLSMGRTVNLDGFEELINLQGRVNAQAYSLWNALKEFKSNMWKKASASDDALVWKFIPKHGQLHAHALRLLKMVDPNNIGELIYSFELLVSKCFYDICQNDDEVPTAPDTTFSKGTYLVPHKDEFEFPTKDAVGIYYSDIKSQNKSTMKKKMIQELINLPENLVKGKLNCMKEEYYHVIPTGKETCYSLLKNVGLGSSSWGHQLTMWYQNFVSMSPKSKQNLFDRTGISSQEEYLSAVRDLASKALKLKFGTDTVKDLVLKKTKGSLANEASINVFEENGLDWINSPDGRQTFQDTYESIFQDLFKGKFFEPDRSTFIAPNLFRALEMVKHDVGAIVPLPKHLDELKGTTEARIGRYPSNTADNPVHTRVMTSKKLRFSILAVSIIESLVADVDGDELVLLLKALVANLKGKALLKQSIWNLLIDLSIEKCTNIRCEIEDVKPIDVIKTMEKWTDKLDPKIKDIVLNALIYPNQAAVGPVANHIQSISIHGLMTVFLMLVLGALLQNAIDTQKSLNDFFWLIQEKDMVEKDGKVYFPDPSKWRVPGKELLQKVLLTDPFAWMARPTKSFFQEEKTLKDGRQTYIGFSPEILLPVCMKEWFLKEPEILVDPKDPNQLVTVKAPYQNDNGVIKEQVFTIHVNYFSFFKSDKEPYMPGIQAISHWIKFQLKKANPNVDLSGYSQAKTPWHSDSTGQYTHEWRLPYGVSCDDDSNVMKVGGIAVNDIGKASDRFLTAGTDRIVSTWYDIVKELAEESWTTDDDVDLNRMWNLSGTEKPLNPETIKFLRSFNVADKNAYTSSDVPKDIAEDIVSNFSEATKHMVELEKASDGTIIQAVFLLEKAFKLKKNSSNEALVNGAIRRIDPNFWSLPILPFGLDWNNQQAEKLELDLSPYVLNLVNEDVASIARRNHNSQEEKQEAIDNLALREEGAWLSIKRKLQSVFEFFAAQTLPSACPIWTKVKGHLTPDKRSNWESVYEALSIEHGKSLHKCPSCYREFLSWKGGSSIDINVERFGAAGKLLKVISMLPSKAEAFGKTVDDLPPFMRPFLTAHAVEMETVPAAALTTEMKMEVLKAAKEGGEYYPKAINVDEIMAEDTTGFNPFAW